MSILLRRRGLMSSKPSIHIIYDNGATTASYEFGLAGYFGATAAGSTNGGYKNDAGYIQVRAWDATTSKAYGCAFLEKNGIERNFLKKYSEICFDAKRDNNANEQASGGYAARCVGVFGSNQDPTLENAIALSPESKIITTTTTTTFSIPVSEILNVSTSDRFYVGGGVLTLQAKSPGWCTLQVYKIWLE